MFCPLDQQTSLLEAHLWIPDGLRKRLESGWAHIFRTEVLDMIPESEFASLYHDSLGRPNIPVAIMVSLSILKEMLDLTDEALMESYHFDLRFHHALRLPLDKIGMAIRSLYYFLAVVVGNAAISATFDAIVDQIIEKLGLNTGKQRLDSTHIRSNMANLSRLGLFVKALEQFLARLKKLYPALFESLPKEIRERYGERPGHFADVRSGQGRRRLEAAAKDLLALVNLFLSNADVNRMRAFQLLKRLLDEQCIVDTGNEEEPAVLKPPKEIASDSLQNPSDPDATYDGHKGQGYQIQISETCDKDNPIQVITHVEVEQAHKSDQKATIPTIDALSERGHTPDELFADTNYNSGQNMIDAADRGVTLIAPTPGQVDPNRIGLGHFELDIENLEVVACPEGFHPIDDTIGSDGETHNLLFDPVHCAACELSDECPAGKRNGRLRFHPTDVATAFSRAREETEAFKEAYKIRSGIESTNAEGKTAHGMEKMWTRELPRVTFAGTMKTLAINVKRFMRYQCDQILKNGRKTALLPT